MVMKYKNFALSIMLLSAVGMQGMDQSKKSDSCLNNAKNATLTLDPKTGKYTLQSITPKNLNLHYNAKTGEWTEQNSSLQSAGIGTGIVGVPVALAMMSYFIATGDYSKAIAAALCAVGAGTAGAYGSQTLSTEGCVGAGSATFLAGAIAVAAGATAGGRK